MSARHQNQHRYCDDGVKVGRGAHGCVYLKPTANDGGLVATKICVGTDGVLDLSVLNEVQMLRHCRGASCVAQLLQARAVMLKPRSDLRPSSNPFPARMHVRLEGCPGSLDLLLDYVRAHPPSAGDREALLAYVARQLLHAVGELHDRRIMHRDIKPANVLVDARSQLKLCDLGMSCHIQPGRAMTPDRMTACYRPPEVRSLSRVRSDRRCAYGPEADMYSVGCTLFEVATLQRLFPLGATYDEEVAMNARSEAAKNEYIEATWTPSNAQRVGERAAQLWATHGLSTGSLGFVLGLLDPVPSRRVLAPEGHPWIQETPGAVVDAGRAMVQRFVDKRQAELRRLFSEWDAAWASRGRRATSSDSLSAPATSGPSSGSGAPDAQPLAKRYRGEPSAP